MVPGAGSFLPQSGSGPLLSLPPLSGVRVGTLGAADLAFPQVKQVSLCSLSGAEAGSSATWDLESLIELFAVSSFIAGNRTLSPALLGGKLFKEEKSELDNVITPIQARVIRVARRSTNHCTTDAGHGQPAVLWLRSINRPKQPQRFLTGFAFSG